MAVLVVGGSGYLLPGVPRQTQARRLQQEPPKHPCSRCLRLGSSGGLAPALPEAAPPFLTFPRLSVCPRSGSAGLGTGELPRPGTPGSHLLPQALLGRSGRRGFPGPTRAGQRQLGVAAGGLTNGRLARSDTSSSNVQASHRVSVPQPLHLQDLLP